MSAEEPFVLLELDEAVIVASGWPPLKFELHQLILAGKMVEEVSAVLGGGEASSNAPKRGPSMAL